MKVHTITKTHAAATIAATGSLPMTKTEPPVVGTDMRMAALILAQEVLAYNQKKENSWYSFAHRVIELTTDGRKEFVKLIRANINDNKKQLTEAHPNDDVKGLKKTLNSATVDVSRLTTIANAWNAGATMQGMGEFYEVPDPINVGFRRIYEYAQTFTASKGGRKVDPLLVKLEKWLKNNATDATSSVEDQAVFDAVTALYGKLATPSTVSIAAKALF